jgi:UDP-glucose 4-epimerase
MNYGNWFNVPYAITYFYNVYGGREIQTGKYATLIALFKEKMKKGEPLTVVSPGSQKRNFTHIDDIIDGLVLVGENGYGDEFGIGSPESFSIIEVAELFNGKIEMLPERRGNRMAASVITEKTTSLGWSPKVKLKDYISGLRKYEL